MAIGVGGCWHLCVDEGFRHALVSLAASAARPDKKREPNSRQTLDDKQTDRCLL